jgi:ribosomal protein L3 glutamine methyltransferase
MTVLELIKAGERQLLDAGVAFGHGTTNAFDEAAWLVLWQLGLPLDSALDDPQNDQNSVANQAVPHDIHAQVATIFIARITSRKPAAYLTREAWLQGVPFYVDERVIVPRSFIAELLMNGSIDYWLTESTKQVLDLCTGNGSLAVLAAMVYPDVSVDACDISLDALDVARINVDKHGLQQRITLLASDGLASVRGPYDLIVCNPPYVNAASMAALPPEYHAEPALALDGNSLGGVDGMDFIRQLLVDAPAHMSKNAVLVLEIGNEREHFEAAFPHLQAVWLETSAGEDQVLLVTREALSPLLPAAKPDGLGE